MQNHDGRVDAWELIRFYGLAFGLSWLGFVPLLAGGQPILIFPGVGPVIAAWVVGRPLRLRWRAAPVWYATAAVVPALLIRMLPQRQYAHANVLPTLLMSLGGNVWEEIGWRGFAQPRLHRLIGFLPAVLVVGLLWAAWHAPFFVWASSPMSRFYVPGWALFVVAESVVLGWLFERSGRSVGVATVFHITMNVFAAVLGVPWAEA